MGLSATLVPVTVLYHGDCYDGFCSAWLFWRHVGRGLNTRVEYIPVQYGEDVPWEKVVDHDVRIFDFSYNRATMREIAARAAGLEVLDHHKTSAWLLDEDFDPSVKITHDVTKSCAHLVADSLGIDPNWLVQYTEDRDLWKWALPYSREVSTALRLYEFDFLVWNEVLTNGQPVLVDQGKVVRQYQKIVVQSYVRPDKVAFSDIGGHVVPVVNCPDPFLISETIRTLAHLYGDHPFAAGFFVAASGHVVYSLRSRNDFDVSVVAKKLGGGGHPGAAGFRSNKRLPFCVADAGEAL